jgi:hypothetical protein
VGWGQNDNQVGKLLGQKMMDEIDFFALCSHARSFFGEEFCNTCAGAQKYHQEPCKYPFSGPLTMAQKCYYCKTVGTWF